MKIHFYKYQGTGNDFVLIDNRESSISLSQQQVAFLCDRHFGIGADGLMLLELEEGYDFKMVYYNSDGNESTMCGNGGRCITAFAKHIGVVEHNAKFVAIDGGHTATIHNDGRVSLQMQDVDSVSAFDDHTEVDTGSPHYVTWNDDINTIDVYKEGNAIRNRDKYQPKGINVNFVQRTENGISVRTYERGVENETLSCGTGVTAATIASSKPEDKEVSTDIKTPGGQLNVSFKRNKQGLVHDVILTGPATYVFEGDIEI